MIPPECFLNLENYHTYEKSACTKIISHLILFKFDIYTFSCKCKVRVRKTARMLYIFMNSGGNFRTDFKNVLLLKYDLSLIVFDVSI